MSSCRVIVRAAGQKLCTACGTYSHTFIRRCACGIEVARCSACGGEAAAEEKAGQAHEEKVEVIEP